jgi:hypothetical protein
MDGCEHMKMNIGCWWIDNGQRKTEVLGENPSPLPVHSSQIPCVLLWNEIEPYSETGDYSLELWNRKYKKF